MSCEASPEVRPKVAGTAIRTSRRLEAPSTIFASRSLLGLRRQRDVYVRPSRDRRDIVEDGVQHLGVADVLPDRFTEARVEGGRLLVSVGSLLGQATLDLRVSVLPAAL